MSRLYSSYSSRISESLSRSLRLKVDSSTQLRLNGMPSGFQLLEHDSSSSQTTQPDHDMTVTARANSRDQCISSESGQEIMSAYNLGKMKPTYMTDPPDTACNTPHTDYNHAITCMPYSCGDPYSNVQLAAYGPGPVIMGVTNAKVSLPLEFFEDEPIYVNAKQYNGILRRRQSRAKQESRNKLIKARKPYLHESRHLHALNRVRGTGGRFLSTKKPKQSERTSVHSDPSKLSLNPFGHNKVSTLGYASTWMETGSSTLSSGNAFHQQTDGGFLGISYG